MLLFVKERYLLKLRRSLRSRARLAGYFDGLLNGSREANCMQEVCH